MSWRPDQKLLATAIAQLAALIFERSERRAIEAKIAADADRLKRQLSLINGLMESETVRTSMLEDAIRTCMESFSRTADIDRVTVMLYADEINDFEFSQSYARARGSFEPVPAELQQRMRNTDRSRFDRRMTVDDLRSEPDVMAHFGGVIEHLGVRSAMQTPIQVQGRLVGAVQAFTVGRTTKWQADHEMTITAVAQIVALAVERHQRLRVERRLRHANRAAEEANKAKSLFLANMSHEIRTPMNGVFGMTDLLMQTELSERQSRLVGTINQSAKTLLTIINDILDVSRIESGKFELDRHEFDLRHCVEGAVEMFAEDAQKRGLELAFFMAGDVPELVVGDAVRLRQICINLIGNALKFTKAGHVSVRVEMVGQAPDTATVRFEINDTGIGIDPQVRERLFQPFAQADSSITRRFGGTGLGLSISRHLVQLMNGRIDLESTPGVGTRITFTLPMTIAAARTKEIRADISVLAGKRVLVVDDRDMNREIITAYLDGCGAKVDAARSAESALDQMRAAANEGSPFAVAIIDMIMPTLNGLELADLVRADPAIAKTELIMVTSMSWKGDAKAVRARGIRNLLTKPVRRSDLLEAVCNALTAASVPAGIAPVPADRAVRVRVDAHILVAEDNPVNEEVAREHLTSLGCTVSVARNGIEAVEAFGLGAFDLILMDCQMPELDGLSATQRIRAIEQTADAKRTPIVAVTANAFAEDRVACLAAGMDGYMSKPFTEDQLIDALNKWCPDRVAIELAAAPPAEAGNPRAAPPKPSRKKKASSKPGKPSRKAPPRDRSVEAMPPRPADLDPAFMVGLRDRTPKLFERLIETYLGHTPKTVESLANAVADGNVAALKLAAHSLKSSSANVGARRVAELARRLEALAAGNEPAAVAALACDLEAEFEAVRREFQATLMARRKA
jgi:signal transduction histidine kinase/CheY-like chemotaxis protein/HPt (histidine-containing phosphotransfer) domain-containing protein